jgi:hypothetical protein
VTTVDRKTYFVARWESGTGKYWVELERDEFGYKYSANYPSRGWLSCPTEDLAIRAIEKMIAAGRFVPAQNDLNRSVSFTLSRVDYMYAVPTKWSGS